jgi:hypothetical protein
LDIWGERFQEIPMRVATSLLVLLLAFVPAVGCGYGSGYNGGTMSNPGTAPAITELVPAAVPAGSLDFIITINGTSFGTGAQVFWNGTALTTSYVTAAQVTAMVPAADVATAGNASVYVRSGTMNSNTLTFTVQ